MRRNYYIHTPFLLSLCLIFLFSSCGSDTSENSEVAQELDSLSSTFTVQTADVKKTRYKLPSPVELYRHMKDNEVASVINELNNPDFAGNYVTKFSKSVIFGIYASDLAYCTVFEHQQETHEYFRVLKIMAEQLGITEGYDTEILTRLDNNLNNSDSLYHISADSYWEVCTYLENNNKANTLALILLGGWVESLFIAINSIDTFDAESDIMLRITEQSYLLENLLDYLNSLSNDKQTSEYVMQLTDLQYSFDKLFDNPDDVLITKEQFKEIATKVKVLRTELVNWK